MIGSTFKNWKIVADLGMTRSGHQMYLCECACGHQRKKSFSRLKSKICPKECKKCSIKYLNTLFKKKHGMSGTTIYRRWSSMKGRCLDPNNDSFYSYGGRGIKICDAWLIFSNFYKDMGEPPFKGAQLDRIDPDGAYEPGNCRWVSAKENQSNRRSSPQHRHKYIMINKDKLCHKCRLI